MTLGTGLYPREKIILKVEIHTKTTAIVRYSYFQEKLLYLIIELSYYLLQKLLLKLLTD